MPIGLKSVIGQEGIKIMETRFRSVECHSLLLGDCTNLRSSNIIEAPVTVIEDLEQGLIRITPARNPLGHDRALPGAQKAKPRTSNKAKIARPPNAFILYRQHHHPLVKAEYPDLHNNQICKFFRSKV